MLTNIKFERMSIHVSFISVQRKNSLNPRTNMAVPNQTDDDDNIIKEEDKITSHHYFVSINASKRTNLNFQEKNLSLIKNHS